MRNIDDFLKISNILTHLRRYKRQQQPLSKLSSKIDSLIAYQRLLTSREPETEEIINLIQRIKKVKRWQRFDDLYNALDRKMLSYRDDRPTIFK